MVSDSFYLSYFYCGSSFYLIGADFNELFQALSILSNQLSCISGITASTRVSGLSPWVCMTRWFWTVMVGSICLSGSGYHLGEDEGFRLRFLSSPRPVWGRPGLSVAAPCGVWAAIGKGCGAPLEGVLSLRVTAHFLLLVEPCCSATSENVECVPSCKGSEVAGNVQHYPEQDSG